jgi:hypothetical protein
VALVAVSVAVITGPLVYGRTRLTSRRLNVCRPSRLDFEAASMLTSRRTPTWSWTGCRVSTRWSRALARTRSGCSQRWYVSLMAAWTSSTAPYIWLAWTGEISSVQGETTLASLGSSG